MLLQRINRLPARGSSHWHGKLLSLFLFVRSFVLRLLKCLFGYIPLPLLANRI